MKPDEMISMARQMRDKGMAPLKVYILTTENGNWMVPVPNDSLKWTCGEDENGDAVPMPHLQPIRLVVK